MTESDLDVTTVREARLTFPTRDYDLGDVSRTIRDIDYLWADSVQVLVLLAGWSHVPPRPRMPRPTIAGLRLESPLWMQIALGGGGLSTAWWFFRFAVKNPNEIGGWWTNVKIGRERARQDLERLQNERSNNPADQALRLAASAPPILSPPPESEQQPIVRPEIRPAPYGGPDAFVVPSVTGGPPGSPRFVVEDDDEAIVARYETDAQRLTDRSGTPEIEESATD